MHKTYMTRAENGGTQKLYKFANGYGASVVCHSFSYGNELGLWELAVIEFVNDEDFRITYATPVADDVIGNLAENEVEALLYKIEQLEQK